MNESAIIAALFDSRFSVTVQRIEKAKKQAEKSRILWENVIAVMTPEERAAVEGAK